MSRAKTDEPIEMPSGRQTRVSPSKRVFVLHLDRLPGEGKFIYFFLVFVGSIPQHSLFTKQQNWQQAS